LISFHESYTLARVASLLSLKKIALGVPSVIQYFAADAVL
jgi:hypothetical protein